jgi:type I restriction enzyme, R subunit
MPTPGEHKTVQSRILKYAQEIGRRFVSREDVVFFINGIPVLVIECKNANKDEAIALGVDQIRRYHRETPELLVPEQIFTVTDAIGFSYGVTWNTVGRNIFNWKQEGGLSSPPHSQSIRGLENRSQSIRALENHSQTIRGLENPRSFFDPYGEIDVGKNRLPHWQQGAVFCFVTWRLAESCACALPTSWSPSTGRNRKVVEGIHLS